MGFHDLGRDFFDLVQDRSNLFDLGKYADVVNMIATAMSDALLKGARIYWCGNGGSAAQAQHLAAELSGRFLREREGLASEALSVNSSTVTAIANDFGYDSIFSRQVQAFVRPGDVLVALTTSGQSANLLNAARTATSIGATVVALSGNGGGPIAKHAHVALVGPNSYSAVVQELHLIIGHILCDLVEQRVIALRSAPVAQ